jgi:hypothetical protein
LSPVSLVAVEDVLKAINACMPIKNDERGRQIASGLPSDADMMSQLSELQNMRCIPQRTQVSVLPEVTGAAGSQQRMPDGLPIPRSRQTSDALPALPSHQSSGTLPPPPGPFFRQSSGALPVPPSPSSSENNQSSPEVNFVMKLHSPRRLFWQLPKKGGNQYGTSSVFTEADSWLKDVSKVAEGLGVRDAPTIADWAGSTYDIATVCEFERDRSMFCRTHAHVHYTCMARLSLCRWISQII